MAGKCWTDRHRFWIAKQTLSYTRTRWFSGSRRDRLEISHPGSERQAGKGRGRESGLSLMRERSLHSLRLSLLNAIVTLLQNVPLSVTGARFRDAPRGLENFKYIETLYDASTMSGKLLLPFEARNYLSYASYKDSLALSILMRPSVPRCFSGHCGLRNAALRSVWERPSTGMAVQTPGAICGLAGRGLRDHSRSPFKPPQAQNNEPSCWLALRPMGCAEDSGIFL